MDWEVKYNVGEDSSCEEANIELAEAGCDLIINNSFGFEPYMLKVAPDYPEIQFISCTNQASAVDDLANTHNAFANIYEGRYLAGVVAGMKLQEMIDNGEITADQAVIGYVGAYSFAEVISGFTAYYLGAKSVCPSVTMKVQFVGSWSDATLEGNAAQALCDEGCIMISQHSDNTTPATAAQNNGAFHTGYNNDMISVAPDSSLIGTRIDWSVYFEYAIEAVANGESFEQDWCHGMDEGAVVMTPLNEDIAAAGTAEKLAEVEQQIHDGHEGGDDGDIRRQADLIGDHLAQRGDGDVGADQHKGGRKAHAEGIGHRRGQGQRGAGAQHEAEGGVVAKQSVQRNLLESLTGHASPPCSTLRAKYSAQLTALLMAREDIVAPACVFWMPLASTENQISPSASSELCAV